MTHLADPEKQAPSQVRKQYTNRVHVGISKGRHKQESKNKKQESRNKTV